MYWHIWEVPRHGRNWENLHPLFSIEKRTSHWKFLKLKSPQKCPLRHRPRQEEQAHWRVQSSTPALSIFFPKQKP
jgi:hypothetical protein